MASEKLARSADKKRDIPPQTYEDHVLAVVANALFFATKMLRYQSKKPRVFKSIMRLASGIHDLGKLDALAQNVLSGRASGPMLNHVDAGVAVLLELYKRSNNFAYLVAAIIVHGHHIGFMNERRGSTGFSKYSLEQKPDQLRDSNTLKRYVDFRNARKNMKVCKYVNLNLKKMIDEHLEITDLSLNKIPQLKNVSALDTRLLSACLVAADHGDAARHMRYPTITKHSKQYLLRPKDRKKYLEKNIREQFGTIGGNKDNPRQSSRLRLFRAARTEKLHHGFYAITGPVGSSKTTASVELALRLCEEHNLRRIFCLAPYNTIIDQTVQTYRDLLILPDEFDSDSDRIVAAHHCNNEYGNQLIKAYNVSWMSPIVVTSAVQFFESLASNIPARIKKLHNLPGSVLILDEWHTLMPAPLWGVVSLWLRQLVNDWGCKIIYSSGTPVNYWDIPILQPQRMGEISKIAPECIVTYPTAEKQLRNVEKKRIRYEDKGIKTLQDLSTEIFEQPGPRLVICNTVQNAALLAHTVSMQHGRSSVEHLSTALAPRDREIIINRIKKRLATGDPHWTLVATSCVDSGLDFSFRTGFIEKRSVMAPIQGGGRVNRKFEYNCCTVFHFDLFDNLKTENSGFLASRRILQSFIEEGVTLSPDLCTPAIVRELEEGFDNKNGSQLMRELVRAERTLSLKEVEGIFNIITTPTVPILINSGLFERFLLGQLGEKPWLVQKEIQSESMHIYRSKLDKVEYPFVCVSDLLKHDMFETDESFSRFDPANIRIWAGGYDKDFLGYMNEVLFQLGVAGVERAPIPWSEELNAKYE